jgi:glycosyltransferase involved in cell wall biosynthesis
MSEVSIVTISFNLGAFLEQAIRSVIEQSHVDLEYIVVDAGSNDGSREIISKYRESISKIIFEPDTGPANGLNKGFLGADGRIFGYLNADDILLPGSLRDAVKQMDRSQADVLYGDGYFIDETGACTGRCMSTSYNYRRLVTGGMVVMQQSTFFTADAFKRVGGFNEDNYTCWDGELFFEFAKNGLRIAHAEKYWSAFRIHSGGITGSGRLQEQYRKDHNRIYGPSMALYGRRLPWLLKLSKWETRLANPRRSLALIVDRISGPPSMAVGTQ